MKYTVDNGILSTVNKHLAKLPHTNRYTEYEPHLTIAYLNPNTGNQYVTLLNNSNMNKYVLKPCHAVYSMPNGEKIKIDINYGY